MDAGILIHLWLGFLVVLACGACTGFASWIAGSVWRRARSDYLALRINKAQNVARIAGGRLRVLILGCAAIGLAAALMAGGHQVVDHEQLTAVELHYESLMIGPVSVIDAEDARVIFERRKKYPPRQVAETEDQPREAWDRDLVVVV